MATLWIDQQVNDDYWSLVGHDCQKIKVTSSVTINSVKVLMYQIGQGDAHIEVWTDEIKAGSQIGGDSASVTITAEAGSPAWYEFTWASNAPALTADCFIHLVEEDGTLYMRSSTDETDYEDTNYDLWQAGSEIAGDNDLAFQVYIEVTFIPKVIMIN